MLYLLAEPQEAPGEEDQHQRQQQHPEIHIAVLIETTAISAMAWSGV
jgi:hypothetical protein